MKFEWEDKDIVCGRYVCKPLQNGNDCFAPSGWTAKWTYKIGFIGGRSKGTVLICMADGMVSSKMTPTKCAERLNKDKMIPMPHAWLRIHINYLRDDYINQY